MNNSVESPFRITATLLSLVPLVTVFIEAYRSLNNTIINGDKLVTHCTANQVTGLVVALRYQMTALSLLLALLMVIQDPRITIVMCLSSDK